MVPPAQPERNGGHTNILCSARWHVAVTMAEKAHALRLCLDGCSCVCHPEKERQLMSAWNDTTKDPEDLLRDRERAVQGLPSEGNHTPEHRSGTMPGSLTFLRLHTTNLARCHRWHPNFPNDGWTGGDWGNAMGGEAGEALEVFMAMMVAAGCAQNNLKKLRRGEERVAGKLDPSMGELLAKVGSELADMVIYADLLLAHYGVDLEHYITRKFNEVSDREGWPERL